MPSALYVPSTPEICTIRRRRSRSRLLGPNEALTAALLLLTAPAAAPMPAAWASMPRDLLANIFHLAANEAVQKGCDDGVGLAEAAALLAAFSPCRWWREMALAEACLPLRLDSPEQLRCPLLSLLRCRQLALPTQLSSPSSMQSCAAADVCSLLSSTAFRQRSGACLSALLRAPADRLGCSILECCSRFTSLRRLSLARSSGELCHGGKILLGASFPSSLHTLELHSNLFWSARVVGWQPPAGLQQLVQRSPGDLTLGHATLCPCPEHAAHAARTATLHTSAVQSAVGCRRLEVSAKWVVLSTSEREHVQALLEPAWGAPLQALHLDAVLEAWLGVLASILASASIACLDLTASELSLYSQPCGRMAKLALPRWQQPGDQRVVAHGLEARLRWPVAGQGPARFALTMTKPAACMTAQAL